MFKSLIYQAKDLGSAVKFDLDRFYLRQFWPSKPRVINLLVNDICNSKCQMCLIWKNKKTFEFSVDDLAFIGKNKLFSNVEHVGITGGEPTLRKDLSKIAGILIDNFPKLIGLSLITNAIVHKKVISQIEKISEICDTNGKDFSFMVSLDGVGEVHDTIRGRKGNFTTAIKVISHFKNKGIRVITGTTITKDNVWHVDELLDYLIENDLYGRFRIAEFIDRLYNNNQDQFIRNFTNEERYHLQLFFYRLINEFEKSEKYQRTYKSIINMLGGGPRLIGCPYQTEGMVFTSKAELLYCAPKSPAVGGMINENPWSIFKNNLSVRKEILKNCCSNCIHDYHASKTYLEKRQEIEEKLIRKIISINGDKYFKILKGIFRFRNKNIDTNVVLITGWYGTETVGDKAILGALIDEYSQQYPNSKIVVTSIYPFITERTLIELKLNDITVVPVYSYDFISFSLNAKTIIMGGGPLMGMNALAIPLRAFQLGKKSHKVIHGCGIGPVNDGSKYESVIHDIISLADEVKLRDEESVIFAKRKSEKEIVSIPDPAFNYIKNRSNQLDEPKVPLLACYLRELPKNYGNYKHDKEFLDVKTSFEIGLAKYIKDLCTQHSLIPAFYPMHTFTIGNDDRSFYRKFIRKYFMNDEVIFWDKPSTVDSIINSMGKAQKIVCMRFHSVLFADTLDLDYLAIDYTQGGKIKSYLKEKGKIELLHSLNDVISYKRSNVT